MKTKTMKPKTMKTMKTKTMKTRSKQCKRKQPRRGGMPPLAIAGIVAGGLAVLYGVDRHVSKVTNDLFSPPE